MTHNHTSPFGRNRTYRPLMSAAVAAMLTLSPLASADGLSALGGFIKKAAETLKNPNTIPILDPNQQEAPTGDTRIPVPNTLYSSMTGPQSRLRDLFASSPRPSWDTLDPKRVQATHDIGYPRLAVRFLRYGPDLPCWTIRAYAWNNAKTTTVETGEVCRGPIWVKDSVGQTAKLNSTQTEGIEHQVTMGASLRTSNFKNTGELRTTGPNPPAKPFGFALSDPELERAMGEVITRLAVHTGYLPSYDPNLQPDQRFWAVDFEPSGMVPSDRARDLIGLFVSPPEFTSTPPN